MNERRYQEIGGNMPVSNNKRPRTRSQTKGLSISNKITLDSLNVPPLDLSFDSSSSSDDDRIVSTNKKKLNKEEKINKISKEKQCVNLDEIKTNCDKYINQIKFSNILLTDYFEDLAVKQIQGKCYEYCEKNNGQKKKISHYQNIPWATKKAGRGGSSSHFSDVENAIFMAAAQFVEKYGELLRCDKTLNIDNAANCGKIGRIYILLIKRERFDILYGEQIRFRKDEKLKKRVKEIMKIKTTSKPYYTKFQNLFSKWGGINLQEKSYLLYLFIYCC